jgi:hypothetical protein
MKYAMQNGDPRTAVPMKHRTNAFNDLDFAFAPIGM